MFRRKSRDVICSNAKNINKQYANLTANLVNKTPCNKLCVYLIGPYKFCRKGKEPLILKYVTAIDIVTSKFEVIQYSHKKKMATMNLKKNYLDGQVSMSSTNHV